MKLKRGLSRVRFAIYWGYNKKVLIEFDPDKRDKALAGMRKANEREQARYAHRLG